MAWSQARVNSGRHSVSAISSGFSFQPERIKADQSAKAASRLAMDRQGAGSRFCSVHAA